MKIRGGRMAFLFLYLQVIFCLCASAQVITFKEKDKSLPIGRYLSFYEDKGGALTIQDFASDTGKYIFVKSASDNPNFGNTSSAVWCKFTVDNVIDRACFLQFEKPLINSVEIYIPDKSGGFIKKTYSSLAPWHNREIESNIFFARLLDPRSSPTTFYIRFKNDLSIDTPISLGTMEACLAKAGGQSFELIMLGLLVAMMVYNFFIWLMIREKSYLLYVLSIFFLILIVDFIYTGVGFHYLWPSTPSINSYLSTFAALSFLFTGLFASSLLQINLHAKFLQRGLYVIYVGCAYVVMINVLGLNALADISLHWLAMTFSLYLILIGVVLVYKRVSIAIYFLSATFIALLSNVLHILYVGNYLPRNSVPNDAILIGYSLETLLFAFAMAHKIRSLRKEKEKMQLQKIRLMEEQQETLERLVAERTDEIATQNEEISSQNEELLTQQEQISKQSDDLAAKNLSLLKAQSIIETQHQELQHYTQGLEAEAKVNAKDLVEANQQLVQQNHQLEQFAFIIAHNLRAPVARVQGLGNILHLVKNDQKQNAFVLTKIVDSINELDQVLKDLARILHLKKGSGNLFEVVYLPRLMDKVLHALSEEISAADARITTDFTEADELYSLPQYLESILYNLISNAIKYKAPKRKLEIFVNTQAEEGSIKLMVRDNGIGLNLAKYREKLFGLYKRFHFHVEGKGLGLHLVKVQVESLGGTIDVFSTMNEGTAFEIVLPVKEALVMA